MSNGIDSVGVVGVTSNHYAELTTNSIAYKRVKPELDNLRLLQFAVEALGVIGDGYCYCFQDRDPRKEDHDPECERIRDALERLG